MLNSHNSTKSGSTVTLFFNFSLCVLYCSSVRKDPFPWKFLNRTRLASLKAYPIIPSEFSQTRNVYFSLTTGTLFAFA